MTHALSIAGALFIFGWAWFVTVESLVSIGCHEDEDELRVWISEPLTDVRVQHGGSPTQATTASRTPRLSSANVVNDEHWTA